MRAILQGFGPDLEIDENPSQLIVEALGDRQLPEVELVPVVWPNSTATVRAAVPRLLADHEPDLWLGLGLAPRRSELSIERRAVNRLDFPYPDADGYVAEDDPIETAGPPSIDSDIRTDAVLDEWRRHGIEGHLSDDAGAFLCNASLYLALRISGRLGSGTRCGFIHVPPATDLPRQVDAIELALKAAVPA